MTTLRITEPRSGLAATAAVLADRAPANAAFLARWLTVPRTVPAIHAMWTGPEISCPIPVGQLPPDVAALPLPGENATLNPEAGDLVLSFVAPRMWGGNPDPIFDLGLFYGPGARLLFPIGWLAGSVVAKVPAAERAAAAEACGRIRRAGACEVTFELLGAGTTA